MTTLTQERLKSLLHYDPITGHFTWLTGRAHVINQRAGSKADKGYRCITINGKHYYEHRLAFLYMTGAFPKQLVDHINRVPFDNRWENLREATPAQNARNANLSKLNTSGYAGVSKVSSGKYQTYINFENKRTYLGTYESVEAAAAVVAKVRRACYGEFAPKK